MDWNSLIQANEREIKAGNNNVALKNEIGTFRFFKQMIDIQLSFIEKTIDELNTIYHTYNPQPQKITKDDINKEEWNNLLKDYPDLLSTKDLAPIFKVGTRTINEWVKEGYITPIDKSKRPQQFIKDDIKMYILTKKH
jgi:hypothetical protein